MNLHFYLISKLRVELFVDLIETANLHDEIDNPFKNDTNKDLSNLLRKGYLISHKSVGPLKFSLFSENTDLVCIIRYTSPLTHIRRSVGGSLDDLDEPLVFRQLARWKLIADERLGFLFLFAINLSNCIPEPRFSHDFPQFFDELSRAARVPAEEPEAAANCRIAPWPWNASSYRPDFFSIGTRESRGKGQWERPGPGLGEGRDGRRAGALAGVAATPGGIDARPGPSYESQLESYADENGQGKDTTA